jgi:hypothetical protein
MSRRSTSVLSLLLATSLTLAPLRTAFAADDAETITVWTTDGGVVRGEIVEIAPGDHITVKLATGETKRVEWSDVDHDSTGAKKKGTGKAAPAVEPDDEEERAPRRRAPARKHADDGDDGPRVRLTGDSSLVLERYSGSGRGGYKLVCHMPCNVPVDAGDGYRVSGPGMRASDPFEIRADTVVNAHLGTTGRMVGGIVALGLGGTVLLTGAILWGTAKTTETVAGTYGDPVTQDVSSSAKTAGVVLVVTGALAMVIGIAVLASNTSNVELREPRVEGRRGGSSFAWTANGFVF